MPLASGSSRAVISQNIAEMMRSGHPQAQAVAAALRMAHRAAGGPAPMYQTAAPLVNAQGFVPVSQPGSYNIDLTTGALTGGTQSALQNLAQRGLPISGATPAAAPSTTPTADQAAADAFSQAISASANGTPGGMNRGGMAHLASGGMPSTPWFARSDAHQMEHPEGLIHSTVPGRTDRIPMSVGAGSYVVPADVMAGLGEGNTLAGAHSLEAALHSGPGGVRLPSGPMRSTIPHGAPRMPKLARGGVPHEHGGVPVIVAGGEYLLAPHTVRRIGGGDIKAGHAKLDKWVVDRRAHQVKQIKKLPGPVK